MEKRKEAAPTEALGCIIQGTQEVKTEILGKKAALVVFEKLRLPGFKR
jgi:hypothetical protein